MTFAIYPSLAGRNVFISGGATGIGADIVRAFARNRARVAFVDLQREAGAALARELAADGEAPLFLEADVTDIPALQAAIGQTREKLGPIGVLVNNAANDQRHKVAEVSVEYWDQCQNVNLRHHFFAAQAVHPQMRELGSGSIVNPKPGPMPTRVRALETGSRARSLSRDCSATAMSYPQGNSRPNSATTRALRSQRPTFR